MPSNADEFRAELYQMMHEALDRGQNFVDINARDLHGRLCNYPGPDQLCMV